MSRYIPNQHGAWAMLLVPFIFGTFAGNPGMLHILLFACWLLVYLFMFPVLQWVRTGKAARYKKPALVYGGLLLPLAAILIWLRPDSVLYGLPMLPLVLVNIHYARRNRERALPNDIAAIIQFSLIVFVAYAVGDGNDWRLAGELFAISVLYFIGTAIYVKTIIRERNNRAYYLISVLYHVLMLGALGVIMPKLLIVPLVVLLARAVLQPRTKITAKQSGILEIVYAALITGFVLFIFA